MTTTLAALALVCGGGGGGGGAGSTPSWRETPGAPPAITWVSQPVRAGELCMLQAVGHDASTSVVFSSADGGEATLAPTRVGMHSVFFLVPNASSAGDDGRFSVRLQRSDGVRSAAVAVNAPAVWWFQGDLGNASSPGGWLRVFGTALTLPSAAAGLPDVLLCAEPHSAPPDAGCHTLPAEAVNASSYATKFAIPSSLPPRRYRLWYRNAQRAPPTPVASLVYDSGSRPSEAEAASDEPEASGRLPPQLGAAIANVSTLEIRPAPPILAAPASARRIFSVLDYGATARSYNDASAAIRAALAAAANSSRPADVYFPRGRYILDVGKAGLVIPAGVTLRG